MTITPAKAAAVSATLRRAGYAKSQPSKHKFGIPSTGCRVTQRGDNVRVASIELGGAKRNLEKYANTLTSAGYVVDTTNPMFILVTGKAADDR